MEERKKKFGRGKVHKESVTTNDNHFTLLGFTCATGEPVMCGVIIEGNTLRPEIVTGMDIFAKTIGNESDNDFIKKQLWPWKIISCGPKCTYKGKEVPCMVACNESGGISTDIKVRLERPFLKCVNDPGHPWVVCIGIPYGASYWQVGDSSGQNGPYKMVIARAKKEKLLHQKRMSRKKKLTPNIGHREMALIALQPA